jgi:hypothetical protein
MEVCTICGAFLVTGDAPDRLDSHFSGKQHQGYQKIRDTLEKMQVSETRICKYVCFEIKFITPNEG